MSQPRHVASFIVYCHEHMISFERFMYYDWTITVGFYIMTGQWPLVSTLWFDNGRWFLHYDWTMTVGFYINRQHSKIKNSIFFVTFFMTFFYYFLFSRFLRNKYLFSVIKTRFFIFSSSNFICLPHAFLFLTFTHYYFFF